MNNNNFDSKIISYEEFRKLLIQPNNVVISSIDLNKIFIDIMFIVYNIIVVIFISHNSDIHLILPSFVHSYKSFNFTKYRFILLISNRDNGTTYPIYYLNKTIYYKNGMISTKIFNVYDQITQLLTDIIKSTSTDLKLSTRFTFDNLLDFCKNKTYEILKIYVSKSYCYGALVKHKNMSGYIPVQYSKIIMGYIVENLADNSDIPLFNFEYLANFIYDFNMWSSSIGSEFKLITDSYQKFNGMFISLRCNGLNFYFKPVAKLNTNDNELLMTKDKTKQIPIIDMINNPMQINKILNKYEQVPAYIDDRKKKIYDAFYHKHLYNLVILQYIKLNNEQRNSSIRDKLSKIHPKDMDELVEYLQKEFPDLTDADTYKIKYKYAEYSSKGIKKIMSFIDEEIFDFDKIMLNKIARANNSDEIAKILEKYSDDIFVIVNKEEHMTSFPNIYTNCQGTEQYCVGKKLKIMSVKLQNYLSILASELNNPYKRNLIFNPVIGNFNINYFIFTKNINEEIYVEYF